MTNKQVYKYFPWISSKWVFWISITTIIIASSTVVILISSEEIPYILQEIPNTLERKDTDKPEFIEYSDFQCPVCEYYSIKIQKLKIEFGSSINFTYRHYPLEKMHTNARYAAYCAESARLQGKFWEMHDLLFERQDKWENLNQTELKNHFVQYANELGINLQKFSVDINSDEVKSKVEDDIKSGNSLQIKGVPTFLLNNFRLNTTPKNYSDFLTLFKHVYGDSIIQDIKKGHDTK